MQPPVTAIVTLSMASTRSDDGHPRIRAEPVTDGGEREGPVADGARALVVGYGRFGQTVAQMLLTQGIRVTLIDRDTEMIDVAGSFGAKVYYGDGTRLDLLRQAGAADADLVLFCTDGDQLDAESSSGSCSLPKAAFSRDPSIAASVLKLKNAPPPGGPRSPGIAIAWPARDAKRGRGRRANRTHGATFRRATAKARGPYRQRHLRTETSESLPRRKAGGESAYSLPRGSGHGSISTPTARMRRPMPGQTSRNLSCPLLVAGHQREQIAPATGKPDLGEGGWQSDAGEVVAHAAGILGRAQAEFHGIAEGQASAGGDRFPMENCASCQRLDRMAKGVAQVEQSACPQFIRRVGGNETGFSANTMLDGGTPGFAICENKLGPIRFAPGEEDRFVDQPVFDDFGIAGAQLPPVERIQHCRVGDDQGRVGEGTTSSLPAASIAVLPRWRYQPGRARWSAVDGAASLDNKRRGPRCHPPSRLPKR